MKLKIKSVNTGPEGDMVAMCMLPETDFEESYLEYYMKEYQMFLAVKPSN